MVFTQVDIWSNQKIHEKTLHIPPCNKSEKEDQSMTEGWKQQ